MDETTLNSIRSRRAKAAALVNDVEAEKARLKAQREQMFREARDYISWHVNAANVQLSTEGISLSVTDNEIRFLIFVRQSSGQIQGQPSALLTAEVTESAGLKLKVESEEGSETGAGEFHDLSNEPRQSDFRGHPTSDDVLRPATLNGLFAHLITAGLPPEITPP